MFQTTNQTMYVHDLYCKYEGVHSHGGTPKSSLM